MNHYKNINTKEYIKRYGTKYSLRRGLFMASPFHVVTDNEIKKLLYYHRAENYLKKHYMQYTVQEPTDIEFGEIRINNPIWILWDKGIENAPDIVKACFYSVKQFYDSKIISLNYDNVEEYIKLPWELRERIKNKDISIAAASDLIRYALLEHYGGTWLDATVLLTEKLPDYMVEGDFFAFADSFGRIANPALIESWFIHCNPHNKIIREIRNIMFVYWEKEKYPIEYLLCYIISKLVIFQNVENYKFWRSCPYVVSEYSHRLFTLLGDEYSHSEWNNLQMMTSVHKLSYKLYYEKLGNQNNFYNYILKTYLP